jgi:hypothetical protein
MRSRTRILLTVSTILLRQITRFETMSGRRSETNATILERSGLSHFYFHLNSYSRNLFYLYNA